MIASFQTRTIQYGFSELELSYGLLSAVM